MWDGYIYRYIYIYIYTRCFVDECLDGIGIYDISIDKGIEYTYIYTVFDHG